MVLFNFFGGELVTLHWAFLCHTLVPQLSMALFYTGIVLFCHKKFCFFPLVKTTKIRACFVTLYQLITPSFCPDRTLLCRALDALNNLPSYSKQQVKNVEC